jgi:branched-chain amino acid transport system ATP-binding protein
MVEQNALAALELSDRAYVMEQGQVSLSGSGHELLGNPHVRRAYLGAEGKLRRGGRVSIMGLPR